MYIVIVALDGYFPGPLLPGHLLLLLYLLSFSFVHSDSGSHSCAFPLVSPKLTILNARYECAFGCAFVFPRAGAGGARVFVDAGGGECARECSTCAPEKTARRRPKSVVVVIAKGSLFSPSVTFYKSRDRVGFLTRL